MPSLLFISLLCIGLYLPGIVTLPPTDRDESRFSQASRQMIETGDYVRIKFQEEPRHKKPVGIHWLQAASVMAFGSDIINHIWLYRIPSFLGGLLTSLFVFIFGRRLFDPSTALLAAVLTACSLLLVSEAHLATTDALLLASVVAAQGSLALIYIHPRSVADAGYLLPAIFWMSLGFAVLLKGPIVPVICLLTIMALSLADRRFSWLQSLRPLPGLILLTLIICPWSIAIYKATGGTYFSRAVGEDLLPKLFAGVESHGGMPGYFLLLMPITFWPGSIYTGLALFHAWSKRHEPVTRFCLAWLIPNWIFFEVIPTKLPHYILPTYPALALITANALFAFQNGQISWHRFWPCRLAMLLWSLTSVGSAILVLLLPWIMEKRIDAIGVAVAFLAILMLYPTLRLTQRNQVIASIGTACLGALLVLGPTLQWVLPGINALWLSRGAANIIEAHTISSGFQSVPLVAVGYQEPSLVFMTQTTIKLTSADAAADFLKHRGASIAIIDSTSDEAFRQATNLRQLRTQLIGEVHGYHYTKGRWTSLRLYSTASNN